MNVSSLGSFFLLNGSKIFNFWWEFQGDKDLVFLNSIETDI